MPNPSPRTIRAAAAFFAGFGLAVASVGASAAQETARQGDGRQCFLPSQVNGFDPIDADSIHVRVGVRDVYRLELFGRCPDIDWSQRIGIRSTGGSSWVCQGLDVELVVPTPTGPQRCAVSSMRKLGEEEMRAHREQRRRE